MGVDNANILAIIGSTIKELAGRALRLLLLFASSGTCIEESVGWAWLALVGELVVVGAGRGAELALQSCIIPEGSIRRAHRNGIFDFVDALLRVGVVDLIRGAYYQLAFLSAAVEVGTGVTSDRRIHTGLGASIKVLVTRANGLALVGLQIQSKSCPAYDILALLSESVENSASTAIPYHWYRLTGFCCAVVSSACWTGRRVYQTLGLNSIIVRARFAWIAPALTQVVCAQTGHTYLLGGICVRGVNRAGCQVVLGGEVEHLKFVV